MKSGMSSVVALLFFELLLAIATINISFCNGSSYVGCIESEREALWRFKGDLEDPANRLASWFADKDCCRWVGVVCDNFTGHVLQLNLRNPSNVSDVDYEDYESSRLVGKINPSLLDLKHLVYLDLSGNNFEEIHQIPGFLGSMTNLRYLNLSSSLFDGLIPPQLGNLSNLQYLDLNQKYNTFELYAENLNWVSGLSLLKHLDLSGVNLSKASEWLLDIKSLPYLLVLRLSYCQLYHYPLLPIQNFSTLTTLVLSFNYFEDIIPEGLQNLTSLRHLDLSSNYFNSSIPKWFYKLSHLEYLSLSYNRLQGTVLGNIGNLTSLQNLYLSANYELQEKIPTSWKRLCNLKSISLSFVHLSQDIFEILDILSRCISVGLESLDLSNTQLFGHFTNQLGKLKNMHTLELRANSISGSIPMSLGQLSSLEFLDFSDNKLNGTMSEIHFFNLSSLVRFDVSENSLKLKVNSDWVPSFQLQDLGLRSCHLGPGFPLWLSSQKVLRKLDISNTSIDDRIPNWFWKSSSMFSFLNLSHNQIHGVIPNLTVSTNSYFDLSSNKFSGSLPTLFSFDGVDLSNNAFSGSVFHFFCIDTEEPMATRVLNLQNNILSGELPDCWSNWQYLEVLNLGNNKFTGNLPTSMGSLSFLQSLRLHKNHLSGKLPMSLRNCSSLEVLDLSKNQFIGNVPRWIGESILSLKVLNLHSNNFYEHLPLEFCRLGFLQILDLADNHLSGSIPRCVSNFSAMVTTDEYASNYLEYYGSPDGNVFENALLVMKGKAVEYSTILNLVRIIDLSRNNFSGEIPLELTNLQALQSLNLSQNSFTGTIPERIGAMKSLESIDFSTNQLSGKIPHSISNLTFLSYLNLSNNKLIGEIPSSTQLQGFDPSCFTGNELCGLPLKKCQVKVPKSNYENGGGEDDNEHEVNWGLYASMAVGFVMGFWGFVGPLFVSRRWRSTYYIFLNQLWDKFYITVVRICR